MTHEEKLLREEYKKTATKTIEELAAICTRAKLPLFVCIADLDDDGNFKYNNKIVSASLELSKPAKRVNDLLLSVRNCGLKYPENIKKSIDELQSWLDSEQELNFGSDVTVNKFRDYYDIAEGLMEATLPYDINPDRVDDEEEVKTKK